MCETLQPSWGRQLRVPVSHDGSTPPQNSVELFLMCFTDALLLHIRDEAANSHGVVCRSRVDSLQQCNTSMVSSSNTAELASRLTHPTDGDDEGFSLADGPASTLNDVAVEVDVLLGSQDDPLVNVVTRAVSKAVLSYGELRPIVFSVALRSLSQRLSTPAAKRTAVEDIVHGAVTLLSTK